MNKVLTASLFTTCIYAALGTVSAKNGEPKDISPPKPARNLVIGGRDALPGEFPFFAAGVVDCGGTLIHEDIVLTAAHCVAYDGYAFAAGAQIGGYIRPSALLDDPTLVDETEERIDTACIAVHPDYYLDGFADVALVKLANPSQNGQVIKVNFDPSVPAVGDVVTVLGYGISGYEIPGEISDYILPTFLQVLYPMKIQSEDSCIQGDIEFLGGYDPDYLLCILDEDFVTTDCNGDSGGPIFMGEGENMLQLGVLSYGPDFPITGQCRGDRPSYYTKTSTFESFIREGICRKLLVEFYAQLSRGSRNLLITSPSPLLYTELSANPPADCPALPSAQPVECTIPLSPLPSFFSPYSDSPAPTTLRPSPTPTTLRPSPTPTTLRPPPTTLLPVSPSCGSATARTGCKVKNGTGFDVEEGSPTHSSQGKQNHPMTVVRMLLMALASLCVVELI